MHNNVKRLNSVKNKIKEILSEKQLKTKPEVIAVTKTFDLNHIIPLLDIGHIHFGENKIQEAEPKWLDVKKKYKNLQLHMIGKLQTNKAKKAVKIFDYIHSLDNAKLASKISQFEKELNKKNLFRNLQNKNFLILGSAHNQKEIKEKILQNCKVIFLSPILYTKKSKKYLNIFKFNFLSYSNKVSFLALGGINQKNIRKIKMLRAKGFAGITIFKKKPAFKRPVFIKKKFLLNL